MPEPAIEEGTGQRWSDLGRAVFGVRPPEHVQTRPSAQHWNDEELGRLEREVHWLKVWRGGLLVMVLIAYGVTVFLALRPEPLFLVVADAQGKILYEGRAGDYTIPDLFIEHRLKEWIESVRRRSDDAVVNTFSWDKALDMTTAEATGLLQAYLDKVKAVEAQNPGNRWRVLTSFSTRRGGMGGTITKLSRTEYRMIWTETWTPQYGSGERVVVMDGTFRVKLREKTGPLGKFQITVAEHQRAPYGVYVEWFTWNAMSGGES